MELLATRRTQCRFVICAFRTLFHSVLAAGLALGAADAADLPADGALRFFEQRLKADPDDFLAWNQLGERQLIRLRR